MKSNWQTKKLDKDLLIKFRQILGKYEILGLNKSYLYSELKNNIANQQWFSKLVKTLAKIENSEKIFNISKEINIHKNDQRVLEMFAEFDTADRLINTKFFGTFDAIEYLPKDTKKRQPDFLAKYRTSITPIEVKLLSPQDIDENKFFQKFLDKINNHALEQLKGYYQTKEFERGMIYIWTHHQIKLHKIDYYDFNKYLHEKIKKQDFSVTILCMLYSTGLWDFYI